MAYERIYERVNFKDLPDETTPIDAANLAKVETGIEALDTRIVELDASKAEGSIYGSSGISLGRKSSTTVGYRSIAVGSNAEASGGYSFAVGSACKAAGYTAYAGGTGCIANGDAQYARGKFNEEDTENKYACIVGGGSSVKNRKNIYTLDWQGNAVFAGDVTDGKGVSLTSLKTALDALAATVATLTGTQQ